MFTTADIAKFPETALEQTRKMIDEATKQADDMRAKFESIVKEGFDTSKLDLPTFDFAKLDIPGVDAAKLEADVRAFVENVMGYTLVTRRELADLEGRLAKAEKALAVKAPAAKKAAPKKAAKKPAAKKAVAVSPEASA
ncbi:MAG: hypothetical protein R2706_09450 [Acidimicrobiales bacterium]